MVQIRFRMAGKERGRTNGLQFRQHFRDLILGGRIFDVLHEPMGQCLCSMKPTGRVETHAVSEELEFTVLRVRELTIALNDCQTAVAPLLLNHGLAVQVGKYERRTRGS